MALLGIQISPIQGRPIFKVHRFNIFDVGHLSLLAPEFRKRNFNYQVNGEGLEKIVVRVFLNKDHKIFRTKYYYLEGTDDELAYYLVMALLGRLSKKYTFHPQHRIYKLDEW